MIAYTPQRVINRLNLSDTLFDRHLKINISDTKLELTIAVGPIESINAQPGELMDVSLMNSDPNDKRGYIIHPKMVIDLNQWQSRNDWKERCHWFVQVTENNYGAPTTLINRTADQCSRRIHGDFYNPQSGYCHPLHLFVPFKDSDFSEISLRAVLMTDQSKLFSNKKFDALIKTRTVQFEAPTLKITGPRTIAPDQTVTLHISNILDGRPTGRDSIVDLQTQSGYLPKTRLNLNGGEADFKVTALGLEPGDKIKIKAGFFFFPATEEYILTVE